MGRTVRSVEFSLENLRKLYRYDPETGHFYTRETFDSRGRKAGGKRIGCLHKPTGYIFVSAFGKRTKAHRLAWFYVYGAWPREIDHIDLDGSNNALSNLREASHAENMRNCKIRSHNQCGFKGVQLHKQSGRWRARIKIDGRSLSLGLHQTPEQAHAAYCRAAARYHGEFARTA